jgi:hypothetical protein
MERHSGAPLGATLFAAVLLAGCSGAQPKPDRQAIRDRAAAMDAAADRESVRLGLSKPAPEPEARPAEKPAQPQETPAPQPQAAEEDTDARILETDPAGCTWVEAEGVVSFGENDTKSQASAAAVADARSKAMNKFLGVSLNHQFIDFQQEGLKGQVNLTQNLLRVTQLGRVLKEKILSRGPRDVPGCPGCRYGAVVRDCIIPQKDTADKGFIVKLELNRTRFVNGDEAIVKATPTRDAYLYILDVDMNNNASLIFPNDAAKDNKVPANETLVFPSEEFKRRTGLSKPLFAEIPKGEEVSAEMIRVIASKQPLAKSVLDGTPPSVSGIDLRATEEAQGEGIYLNIMRKLNASQEEWVDDAVAFTIFRQ